MAEEREEVNEDVDLVKLAVKVAKLEADVAWLKKYATANLVISVVTMLGIIVAILRILFS